MGAISDAWTRYLDTCNDGDWDGLADQIADPVTVNGAASPRDEYLGSLRRHGACFDGWRWTPERVIEAGEWLTVILRTRGTHVGGWQGLGASGAVVESREIAVYRFEEGRVAEIWSVADDLASYLALSGSTGDLTSLMDAGSGGT